MSYKNIHTLTANLGLYPDITKDYILKHLTQEQIIEKYTGIPVNKNTLIGNSVKSPFRVDKTPTCNYWYNENGKLRFRDWSGDFHGDCFDACARRLNINPKDKHNFIIILHTIAKDFNLNKYENKQSRVIYDDFINIIKNINTKKRQPLIFNIKPRVWNYHDAEYWYKKYKLTSKDLHLIYPAQEIYSTKGNSTYQIYSYSTDNPAYCYYGGKKDGIDLWKIYFPLNKERGGKRFISNSSFLQGKQLITCGRVGIITKSYKDVLCFKKLGLQAVAPSAESVIITPDEYFWMKSKFDYIVSCMDWDRTGIRNAWKLRELYGITPIMFTRGRFNSIDFGAKDLSDYIELNGQDNILTIIKNKYLEYNEEFKQLDNYYKEKIGWITKE